MICPKHNTAVEHCLWLTAGALIELSGKQMSDGIGREEADEIALRLYMEETEKQRELFDSIG